MQQTWEAAVAARVAAEVAEAAEAAKAEAAPRSAEAAPRSAEAEAAPQSAEAAAIKAAGAAGASETISRQVMAIGRQEVLTTFPGVRILMKPCTRSPAAAILPLLERALPR